MIEFKYKLKDAEKSIQLDKLLKIVNLVGSGSEARAAIEDGMVTLNGSLERQGRKDIKSSDVVEFNGNLIRVV